MVDWSFVPIFFWSSVSNDLKCRETISVHLTYAYRDSSIVLGQVRPFNQAFKCFKLFVWIFCTVNPSFVLGRFFKKAMTVPPLIRSKPITEPSDPNVDSQEWQGRLEQLCHSLPKTSVGLCLFKSLVLLECYTSGMDPNDPSESFKKTDLPRDEAVSLAVVLQQEVVVLLGDSGTRHSNLVGKPFPLGCKMKHQPQLNTHIYIYNIYAIYIYIYI